MTDPAPAPPSSAQAHRDFAACERWIFPALRALVRAGYFSLSVEGIERVPRDGRIVYAANHAGWAAMDGLVAGMAIYDHLGPERLPYTIVQDVLLKIPGLGRLLRDLGSVPATQLRDLLHPGADADREVFGVFPEGAEGSSKPFWQAYRMRDWKTGFVRLALGRGARVVPVAILGGDECLPSGWAFRSLKPLFGAVPPLPLTLLPLPTRWRVIFHEPIDLLQLAGRDAAAAPEVANDYALCKQIAAEVRALVQRTLDREAGARPLSRLSGILAGDA